MILLNKKINKFLWECLLNNSKYSSPFQTPEFYEFYNSIDGYHADVFAVEQNKEIKALVLVTIQKEKGGKSLFSKRGIIYGGPIFKAETADSLSLLLDHVYKYYRRNLIYLEIRNSFDYKEYKNKFLELGWSYEEHLNVLLDVKEKSRDNVLSGMKYNRRREINLSYKEGAVVRLAESHNEVKLLYQILKELYVSKVKLPLPDFVFFENIYNFSKAGKVFIVRHEDRLIGGAFCIYNKDSINTLYYAGIRNYHKKIFPTHLAIMGVIDYAVKNKIPLIDLMGAGKPNQKYGVRDFKLQFGGDLVEYGRFQIILKPFLYKMAKKGLELLRKYK